MNDSAPHKPRPARSLGTRALTAVILAVSMLAAPVATSASSAAPAERAAYPKPKAGPWKFKDPFKDAKGTLKIVTKKGKAPQAKSIKITVLKQDNGASCPPPGKVLKVKGALALRKAPKWAGGSYGSPWISAKKDKAYSSAYPNLLGQKPRPVKVKIGKETRHGVLALSFKKDKPKKPHKVEVQMRLYPPGSKNADNGWCIFSLNGKPGK